MNLIKITNDPSLADKENKISPELRIHLEDLYEEVIKGKKSTIKKLKRLIEKYPDTPVLKNYLSVLYSKLGDWDKVNEVNHELVKAYPDYLFGKMNLAMEYLFEEEYEKAFKVFDGKFEIYEMYPNREVFHEKEVKSFYSTLFRCFVGIREFEMAENILEYLEGALRDKEGLNELHSLLQNAKSSQGLDRIQENDKKLKKVKVKQTPVTDVSTPPDFFHKEINLLYENGYDIDDDILNTILNLPRKTLIEDLHKVIDDSIARYGYFLKHYEEYGYDNDKLSFLSHAVFLIHELKSKESLSKIFEVMRQDEKFIEFYFGDIYLEYMWMVLYVIANDRLDELKDFMFEPGVYTFNKAAITDMVTQLAYHDKKRKDEVVQWFRDVFRYNLERTPADNVIDSELLGLMVSDVLDLEAVSLIPELELMYEKGIVDELSCGNIDDVKRSFKEVAGSGLVRSLISMHEIYEEIVSWENANEELQEDDFDDEEYANEPLVKPKKIGRNDPCPCGSGKKYKKCCGR